MSSALIDTVRTLVNEGGMSRSGLARAAGLHANSLRKLGESDWNPTADTLGKLENYLARREGGTALASPEEIINEARNGRMFILVDDESRVKISFHDFTSAESDRREDSAQRALHAEVTRPFDLASGRRSR